MGHKINLLSKEYLEFKRRLCNHDWYYHMSDDYSVYTHGMQAENELEELARQKGWMSTFNQARRLAYGR